MLPYRHTYTVLAHDVDFSRGETLMSLGNYLLHTASLAAEQLGVGIGDLACRQLAWVVSRLHIVVERYPRMGETVTVETWVHDCGRLVSGRHFRMYDAAGCVIGQAMSLWSIIDVRTRRPIDLLEQVDLTPFIIPDEVNIAAPCRIEVVDDEPVATHTVCYSDIDLNRHTNSMKYVQWMLDTLPLERFDGSRIADFEINYAHEVMCGAQVVVARSEADNEVRFHLKSPDERTFCKAKFTFLPN